jgi:hypothetical protein
MDGVNADGVNAAAAAAQGFKFGSHGDIAYGFVIENIGSKSSEL